jgi:tetratricopeptide (TPR) repeat protein
MSSRTFIRLLCGVALAVSACSRDVERAKRDFVERGDRQLAEKNLDAAIIEYRNAIQLDARFGEAYRKLSAAYLMRGDGADALRAAVTSADLLPEVPAAQVEASALLLASGQFLQAREYAARALSKDQANVTARVLVGNALAGLKDIDSAINEFEEALRLDPTQSGIYAGLATLRASRGERELAERMFKEAIALEPKSTAAKLGLAQFYWVTDRFAEAERIMKEAHQATPTDVRTNVTLGIFYQVTRRSVEAEPYLRAAAEQGKDPRLRMLLADYYSAAKRSSDAVDVLEPLTSDRRLGALAGLRLAAIAQENGKPDEALRLIDRAIAADPKNARTAAAKADLLRQQSRLDDAAQTVEQALTANPSSVDVHFAQGRVFAAQGKYEQASRSFEEVLRLNPRVAAARLELARTNVTTQSPAAVETARGAVVAAPQSLDAQLTLARALAQQRQFKEAQQILEELALRAPAAATVHAQLGSVMMAQKAVASARVAFTRALEIDAANLDALRGLTALDFAQGRRADALDRLAAVQARAPTKTGVMVIAAAARASLRQFDEAEQLLLRVVAIDPAALEAYSLLGRIYLAQKRLDSARAQFTRMEERQERPVGALTLVGTIDMLQNRTADAQRAFERVVQLDPKAGVAANNLAWIYLESGGNLEMALHLAETAKAVLPNAAEVHDTLGWAYYKKGALAPAVAALRRSVELDAENLTSIYHLCLAYAKSGAREEARALMTRYLQLDSTSERSTEIRRILQTNGT